MATFTANDAIELAMTIEKNGLAFYNAAAAKTSQPTIKELFQQLAVQEQRHYAAYQSMSSRPTGPVDAPVDEHDEYQVYLQAAMDSAMIGGPEKALEIVVQSPNPQMIVQAAIGFEKDSLLFFYELRDMVEEADRKIVDAIIQEEKAHVLRLSRGLTDAGIKSWWKCTLCGYVLQADQSPETCPSCREKCAFMDVTCYTADCEPGQPDPRLLGTRP